MRWSLPLLAVFISLIGLTAPLGATALEAGQSGYVQAQYVPPQLLVPPPSEASRAWKKQIEEVVRAQRALSTSEIAEMKDEQKVSVEMMTSVLGPSFTRERLPKVFTMLDRTLSGAVQVVEADKKFWHTRRPYLTDKRVKLYIDPIDKSPSYPSGHAAESLVLAEVLGLLVPEKLSALRARADAIARRRVEAGVHYPIDIEAGRMLAMLITGALTGNDDFQDDFAIAKKELEGQ